MAGFERTESPLGKMLSNSIMCYGELVRKGKSHLLQQTSRLFYFKKVLPPPPWSVSSQQHRGKTVHRLSGHDSLKAQGMVSIFSHRIFKLRYAHFFRCNSFALLIDYGYVETWLLCFGKPRKFIWLYCLSHFVVVWSWAFYVWGMPEEDWSDSGQFQQKRTLVARIIITNSKGLNLEMRPEEEMKEQNPPPPPICLWRRCCYWTQEDRTTLLGPRAARECPRYHGNMLLRLPSPPLTTWILCSSGFWFKV